MLYLLFVLTFLCGILFYGMSPSDKSLDMASHQAESMIISFINQHQAARDYLYTWLGVARVINERPSQNVANLIENSRLQPDFEDMIHKSMMSDMCDGNTGTPGKNGRGSCFISRIVCTTANGNGTTGCRDAGARHYVMTYGGWEADFKRPDWWPRPGNRMRRFESWRKAMANRTRGSFTCGTLIKVDGGHWCIDNGETVYKNGGTTCMNQVPPAVIEELKNDYSDDSLGADGKDDLLFCLSEFKQGVQPGHYAVTPKYFYDGFSNAGVGEHQTDNLSWVNLVDGSVMSWVMTPSAVTFQTWGTNYLPLNGALRTGIRLDSAYTLTVLLSAYSGEAIPCGLLQTEDDATSATFAISQTIFKKLGESDRTDGTDVVQLTTSAEQKNVSICNMNSDGHNTGIVSWTFVVNGDKVDVYENAIRRFQNETIASTNGKYLVLGNPTNGSVPYIYGIRYYGTALTDEQIQKNFKVDQKRFGIPDINNGKTGDRCINDPVEEA